MNLRYPKIRTHETLNSMTDARTGKDKTQTMLALRLSHNAGAAEALAGAWQCGHADRVTV